MFKSQRALLPVEVKRIPIEPYLRRALREVDDDHIEATLAERKVGVRGEEPLGEQREPLPLAGVDALLACAVVARAQRLDLHEGERVALRATMSSSPSRMRQLRASST
jgi:hypothetical protein